MADYKVTEYGQIVLAAGQSQTWWHTWTYINSGRWIWFSAIPASDNGKVEITRQWGERDIYGNCKWLVTYKNNGGTTVRFRRYCAAMRP